MSDPTAPKSPKSSGPVRKVGVDPDTDDPNPFGPDAPNVRSDEPDPGPLLPEAPVPTPPAEPLEDDDYAPDESF
jgi:hypothetical protein